MGFGDIFKKSFLEGYQSTDITTSYVLITMAVTCVIALYVFLVYRLATKKVFYSLSFNISLVATALITATIIFTVQSSVVISLGMVGALSIIRFRTAIKDPLDLVYLFWSISIGIICGAGLAQFAVILSLLLTVIVVVLSKLGVKSHPQILVVNANSSKSEESIIAAVQAESGKYKIKSRNVDLNSYTVVFELRIGNDSSLLSQLEKIDGVHSVSLVSHDGEVTY